MDKRQIIYRVNMALTMLKKKNKKYALNIQNMIDIISGKNESDFLYIVDDLSLFLEVLDSFFSNPFVVRPTYPAIPLGRSSSLNISKK